MIGNPRPLSEENVLKDRIKAEIGQRVAASRILASLHVAVDPLRYFMRSFPDTREVQAHSLCRSDKIDNYHSNAFFFNTSGLRTIRFEKIGFYAQPGEWDKLVLRHRIFRQSGLHLDYFDPRRKIYYTSAGIVGPVEDQNILSYLEGDVMPERNSEDWLKFKTHETARIDTCTLLLVLRCATRRITDEYFTLDEPDQLDFVRNICDWNEVYKLFCGRTPHKGGLPLRHWRDHISTLIGLYLTISVCAHACEIKYAMRRPYYRHSEMPEQMSDANRNWLVYHADLGVFNFARAELRCDDWRYYRTIDGGMTHSLLEGKLADVFWEMMGNNYHVKMTQLEIFFLHNIYKYFDVPFYNFIVGRKTPQPGPVDPQSSLGVAVDVWREPFSHNRSWFNLINQETIRYEYEAGTKRSTFCPCDEHKLKWRYVGAAVSHRLCTRGLQNHQPITYLLDPHNEY